MSEWQKLSTFEKCGVRFVYFFGCGFFFLIPGLLLLNRKLISLSDIKTLLK